MVFKKLQTCEKGGGTPQNFFLAFTDELEQQMFIKKTVLMGVNKKQNNFNIYNNAFLKK